jgi:hypothetical protein
LGREEAEEEEEEEVNDKSPNLPNSSPTGLAKKLSSGSRKGERRKRGARKEGGGG